MIKEWKSQRDLGGDRPPETEMRPPQAVEEIFGSPKRVTRWIRATEKPATAFLGRYSDELLDRPGYDPMPSLSLCPRESLGHEASQGGML